MRQWHRPNLHISFLFSPAAREGDSGYFNFILIQMGILQLLSFLYLSYSGLPSYPFLSIRHLSLEDHPRPSFRSRLTFRRCVNIKYYYFHRYLDPHSWLTCTLVFIYNLRLVLQHKVVKNNLSSPYTRFCRLQSSCASGFPFYGKSFSQLSISWKLNI